MWSRRSLLALVAFTLFGCQAFERPTPPSATTGTGVADNARRASTSTPLPAATVPLPTEVPVRQVPSKWGVHLLLDDGVSQWPVEVWDQHIAYARWIVGRGGHVVELIRANDLDPSKWRRFLASVERHELAPIIRLATWQEQNRGHWVAPPTDADGRSYREIGRRFAAFLLALDPTGPLVVVVGNEPNRGDEWGGSPNPAEYARYLLDVSAELHSALGERVIVLNAGLDQYAADTQGVAINGYRSMDAATFLDGMQAAVPGVWDAIDGWSSHAYPLGPFATHPSRREFRIDDALLGGPRTNASPWPGLFNRGLNSYRWELYQLGSYGVRRHLDVYVTETGWRHRQTQAKSTDSAGAVISADEAAGYMLLAFEGDRHLAGHEYTWTPWQADPDVVTAALFALGGVPSRWGHTNLLDLEPTGEVIGLKPQFASLVKASSPSPR